MTSPATSGHTRCGRIGGTPIKSACLVIVQSIVLHLETPEFLAFTSFQESKIGIVVEESIALKKDAAYGAYKRAAEADGEGLGN